MKLRRPQYDTRIEMAPLLDVIFLLLTIFIFTQAMSIDRIKAEFLPVKLPELTTGDVAEQGGQVFITLDRSGQIFLNKQPVNRDQLRATLAEIADADDAPAVYLAPEDARASIDRLPVFLDLIELCRAAGVSDFTVVGAPRDAAE